MISLLSSAPMTKTKKRKKPQLEVIPHSYITLLSLKYLLCVKKRFCGLLEWVGWRFLLRQSELFVECAWLCCCSNRIQPLLHTLCLISSHFLQCYWPTAWWQQFPGTVCQSSLSFVVLITHTGGEWVLISEGETRAERKH